VEATREVTSSVQVRRCPAAVRGNHPTSKSECPPTQLQNWLHSEVQSTTIKRFTFSSYCQGACCYILILICVLSTAQQAIAHHATGGNTPSNFGRVSIRLAHPVIGLDHFAFVVAIGCLRLGKYVASLSQPDLCWQHWRELEFIYSALTYWQLKRRSPFQ